jgi:hypothetical protein
MTILGRRSPDTGQSLITVVGLPRCDEEEGHEEGHQ